MYRHQKVPFVDRSQASVSSFFEETNNYNPIYDSDFNKDDGTGAMDYGYVGYVLRSGYVRTGSIVPQSGANVGV